MRRPLTPLERKDAMYKIKISTDSTSDIPASFRQELNISVLPLTILADGKEYRDGVDITPQEFYKILDEAEVLPVSSQVHASEYLELYRQVSEEGYTDLIHVSLNGKGSGTYQAAVMTRDMFREEHPEAKLNIHIIDSRTYSMGYGMAVVEAARMARSGAAPAENRRTQGRFRQIPGARRLCGVHRGTVFGGRCRRPLRLRTGVFGCAGEHLAGGGIPVRFRHAVPSGRQTWCVKL